MLHNCMNLVFKDLKIETIALESPRRVITAEFGGEEVVIAGSS